MPLPGTAVLDNFNRANANTLGPNWSPFWQSGNDAGILNNQAYDANGTWNGLYWNREIFGMDCEVYVTFATVPTNNNQGIDLFVRLMDVTPDAWQFDGYGLAWYRGAAGNVTLAIQRLDNGVATGLGATVAVTPADGDVYSLQAMRDILVGCRNGTEQLIRSDLTYNAAGYIGFSFPNEANWRLDDFGGGTIEFPRVFAPTHEQALGLTIKVYRPDFSTGTYVPTGTFVTTLQSQINSYSHEIKAMGGCWQSKVTILDEQISLERWLTDGLGRHVEVYDNALERIWEGFVNQVDMVLGPWTITRGPLTDVANRVRVVYSGTSLAGERPVQGNRVVTAPADDAASQAKYGVIEKILSAGGMTAGNAEQARDTYLEENKEPKTKQKLGGGGSLNVTLTCLGYVHWLNYMVSMVGLTGTVNVEVKLASILDLDPNGLFSSANADLEMNVLQVPTAEDKHRKAWDIIKELVSLGDDNDNRYFYGVYADRQVVYEQAPINEVEYLMYPGDPANRVERVTGGQVRPWNVTAGRWMFLPSFLIGEEEPAEFRTDPRYVFIESVKFTAPYTIQIQGGRLDTIPQRLAKWGLAGIGG